jgi:thiamine pyrophosphate-dependent acetolactate synthase large subunit-like protein
MAHLTLGDLGARAWSQEFQELAPLDLEIRADAGLALPRLLERCRERMKPADHERAAERRAAVAASTAERRAFFLDKARAAASHRPIALSHIALQLRTALEPHPWTIAKGALRNWLWRLLPVEDASQWVGLNEGGGLGCGLGFALGASLAHRGEDRVHVAVLGDGDVLFTPSAMWTAAHHQLPLLVVVVNNRTYWNSEGHALQMAEERGRSSALAGVGTRLDDPPTDFATLARAFGLYGEGPIDDPAALLPVLERAIRVVRDEHRLAVVDVVCAND